MHQHTDGTAIRFPWPPRLRQLAIAAFAASGLTLGVALVRGMLGSSHLAVPVLLAVLALGVALMAIAGAIVHVNRKYRPRSGCYVLPGRVTADFLLHSRIGYALILLAYGGSGGLLALLACVALIKTV